MQTHPGLEPVILFEDPGQHLLTVFDALDEGLDVHHHAIDQAVFGLAHWYEQYFVFFRRLGLG